jgi:porin
VFVIGEVQYAINQEDGAKGLPGTYKLGAWYNSNAFANQYDAVANADKSPPTYRGDWSIYAVMDQLVFRPAGSKDGGAGVFARAMGAPGDRNLVNVFLDGGITYQGAFGRDNDIMGLGVGWARISNAAQAGDAVLAGSGFYPIRSSETVIEATYQAQITPWLQLQPDFQYVINPGGGILNPNQPTKRIADAAIFGLRASVTF